MIVTTRFPRDAAERYAREADFPDWRHRLRVYELDLRNLPAVYAFADHMAAAFDSLDVLINNAAQTVRRDPAFYRSMYDREAGAAGSLPDAARRCWPACPAGRKRAGRAAREQRGRGRRGGRQRGGACAGLAPACAALPELWHWPDDVPYDAAGLPRDPRPRNSWVLELPDVEPVEAAEVMLVNAMSPFALCSRLEPLMRRSRFADRYVVNVSAMEGRFGRGTKTSRHPHTNMAKAALNMLTRTAAVPPRGGRHLHEQRGHRLGHGGKPPPQAGRGCGPTASSRRWTTWTAPPASTTPSSAASATASASSACSSKISARLRGEYGTPRDRRRGLGVNRRTAIGKSF